jgi:hypothetical protein
MVGHGGKHYSSYSGRRGRTIIHLRSTQTKLARFHLKNKMRCVETIPGMGWGNKGE